MKNSFTCIVSFHPTLRGRGGGRNISFHAVGTGLNSGCVDLQTFPLGEGSVGFRIDGFGLKKRTDCGFLC